ncbi:prepilin peptidase [Rhodoluna sp.]|uniref:prepilin peptidase n=1 Tax=Rhodoluna sp. TaxID=1969481 RepID=UPI0025F87D14|nr:prepilin peptidase [Rhodoluna sp.]
MDHIFALLGPAYLLAVAVPLARIDVREHRLPNKLVLPLMPIALLGQLIAGLVGGDWLRMGMAAIAAIVAFVVGLLVNRFADLGMGDVKLITGMSLALGWFSALSPLLALVAGFMAATVFVLLMLLLRKTRMGSSVALGPYLLFGFAAALVGSV